MSDPVFSRLRRELLVKGAVKTRIKRRVMQNIKNQNSLVLELSETRKAIAPTSEIKKNIWDHVYSRIHNPHATTALEKICSYLSPATYAKERLSQKVSYLPAAFPVNALPHRFIKLTAAFALIGLVVRMSPFLFIASPTVAESKVSLLPTRGEVSISVGGLWQPVSNEITLEPGAMLRTRDGEASILFHDDGVIRLSENTTIQIHETVDRSGSEEIEDTPTITLYVGSVWVQGLIPSQIKGLTISTSFSDITINEGSVLISEDDVMEVSVFNRRATAVHEGQLIAMVSGEKTQMWDGNVPLLKKVSDKEYDDKWPRQNLARDAVHRKEIAQMQQERRASRAGILPTSKLYSIKRVAETVDVLMTFGSDARAQKRLENAGRRLDEVAALLATNNNQDAMDHLSEYTDELQQLSENTDGGLTDFLLQQSLTEASAEVAAVQPEDDAYLLKLAVLEASTALNTTDGGINELEGILLMDALAYLNRLVSQAELEQVVEEWNNIQESLDILSDEQFPSDVRREVLALLNNFAALVQDHLAEFEAISPTLISQVAPYIPTPEYEPIVLLSEQELVDIVQGIRGRIFLYHMQRSRLNQLIVELKALSGHPEEGRILPLLYTELPNGPENFPDRIKKEITKLRWKTAVETL